MSVTQGDGTVRRDSACYLLCLNIPRVMKTTLLCPSIALLLIFAGCSKAPKPLSAEDLRIARGAIPITEVLSMLRVGYKEPQILQEVKQRRIPARIDAAMEDQFIKSGASPALVAALKSNENTLTDEQLAAFEEFQNEKLNRVVQSAQARQNEALALQEEEQKERNRRQFLQQQTMQNINRNQNAQVSYEIAQKNYEARRKWLEQRIVSQEAEINRLRRYGYNETDLRAANNRLDEYNQQLRNLTPPLR